MKHKDFITDYGGEGKVIILLHGFLASSRYWKRLQPRLSAAGYRVITIDLLGFGNAPKPMHKLYNYREHVEHIDKAVASLNLEEPFILAGHSMGALLAMRFTRESADKVASLILLHPPLYKTTGQAYKVLRSTGIHYRFLLDSKFRRIGWGILRDTPFLNLLASHSRQSREGSLKNVIEAAESLEDLQKLRSRTLLVIGSYDRREYVQNIRTLQLNDIVQLKIKPVSHHSPFLGPDSTLQTINDFV